MPSVSPPRESRSTAAASETTRRGRAPRGGHGTSSEEVVKRRDDAADLDTADTDIQLDVVNSPTTASASASPASAPRDGSDSSSSNTAAQSKPGFEQRSTSFAANVGRGYAGRLSRPTGDATTGTGREGASGTAANFTLGPTASSSAASSSHVHKATDSISSTSTHDGDLPSPARESLLRTLTPDQPPHTLAKSYLSNSNSRSARRELQVQQRSSAADDDIQPDTMANEDGYGFDLSDDDEDTSSSRSVVSRAAGMVSSLWRAGSSMIWADHKTGLHKANSQTGPGD